jgi:uncharacterized membrane protein
MPDIYVVGVVPNRPSADQVVGNLRLAGFPQDAISLIVVRNTESDELNHLDDQSGEEGQLVVSSVAKGATIGGITGLVAGAATMAIPGIGPIVGWGVLLALFGGSGAFVGALSGAFASETVSEQVIERYGMALREGQGVISVAAPDADMAKRAEEVLNAAGANNVNSYMEDVTQITESPAITEVET